MTDTRHEFAGLETIYLAIACGVFVIVTGAIAIAVIRYRRRRDDQHPSGRDERKLLEGAYVVVLAVVTAFLVGATFRVEDRTDRVASGGVRVDVSAGQWNWRFTYPGTNRASFRAAHGQTVLTVPTGREVVFHATSRDVVHSFWVPGTRFKRDVFPHTTTRFSLMWRHPGWYAGECAEFCGLFHGDMRFRVHAIPAAAFRRWLG